MRITLAGTGDADDILNLLRTTNLPITDRIPEVLLNFLLAKATDDLVGCVGLEPFGKTALVRSLAVVPECAARHVVLRVRFASLNDPTARLLLRNRVQNTRSLCQATPRVPAC